LKRGLNTAGSGSTSAKGEIREVRRDGGSHDAVGKSIPKHADQMVRGTVVLPHGLGKSKKVLVIASGDKIREAEAAGADFVGGEDMVEKITKENWTDFDALIATPDMIEVSRSFR